IRDFHVTGVQTCALPISARADRRGESRGRIRAHHRFRGGPVRMNAAWIVFLKEIRENLRDRRTLVNTLVTGPLMAPIIFVLFIKIGRASCRERVASSGGP